MPHCIMKPTVSDITKRESSSNKNLVAILFIALTATIVPLSNIVAQNSHIEVAKNLNYKQPATPIVLDNYLFSTFMGSGKKVYNLKGFEIAKTRGNIVDLKVNPAGFSYAVISIDGKQNNLKIFDAYKANEELFDFGESINPMSMTYSADSRFLYVADAFSNLK